MFKAVMTGIALAVTTEAAPTGVATTEATSAAMMTVLVMIAPTSAPATSVATVRTDVTMTEQDMAGTMNVVVTTAATVMKIMAAKGTGDVMTVSAMPHVAVPAAMTVRDTIVKATVMVAAPVNLLLEVLAHMLNPRRVLSHENNTEV